MVNHNRSILLFAKLDTVTHDDSLQVFFSRIKLQKAETTYGKPSQSFC